ncbi:MAG TPA: aminodeoxychorismate/anthranilate synthase component II [Bacteroidota bacterium]|nr:aminodeoxychorismate/anthranilate synthase component II [Bacteroidota bacterium]
MILVIDNYDSFTYNLVQLIGTFRSDVTVRRNDELTANDVVEMNPERIVLSPGPGRPEKAGITVEVICRCASIIPILGVCLGHQAIGVAFGASVTHAPSLVHGKTSEIYHSGESIFQGLPSPFRATRYHSLVISPQSLKSPLESLAATKEGVVMAVRHRSFPTVGVQFHPESILTEQGTQLIRNWLEVKQ